MVVYADVVFLVNFVFNLLILTALYKLHLRKIRYVRLVFAAVLSGGFGVAVFIPYLQPVISVLSRYFLPLLMSAVCFAPCSVKTLAGGGITILVVSFLYAGLLEFFGLYVMPGALILIPFTVCIAVFRRKSQRQYRQTVLKYGDRVVYADGFFDSGNLLNCNGVPVMLASHRIFEDLFGRGFSMSAVSEWVDAVDIRLVPYRALGKSGVLTGIQLDSAIIDGKVYDKVILGYLRGDFSEQLILSSVMM